MSIRVSYLQNIYFNKQLGELRLHRSHITQMATYDSWLEFLDGFIKDGIPPQNSTNKADAFGFSACRFTPSGNEASENAVKAMRGSTDRRVLAHRAKQYADSHLTLFTADLDNHKDNHPTVSLNEVEETLTALGLAYCLYTSFSHTPAKHKVRIIIPVDRPLTPVESFEVFLCFNAIFNYQLDGSIYDPGDFLYTPPKNSEIRLADGGQSLPVDDYLSQALELPEEARNVVKRHNATKARPATPEEIENYQTRLASTIPSDDVSIHNPKYFNPAWLSEADHLYCNGSHWATMLGLLAKAWLKSGCELSRWDMETLQSELDWHWSGYLTSHYPRDELARAVKDAMKQVGSFAPPPSPPTDCELRAAMKKLSKRKSK